jgi:hypothetical protein
MIFSGSAVTLSLHIVSAGQFTIKIYVTYIESFAFFVGGVAMLTEMTTAVELDPRSAGRAMTFIGVEMRNIELVRRIRSVRGEVNAFVVNLQY